MTSDNDDPVRVELWLDRATINSLDQLADNLSIAGDPWALEDVAVNALKQFGARYAPSQPEIKAKPVYRPVGAPLH